MFQYVNLSSGVVSVSEGEGPLELCVELLDVILSSAVQINLEPSGTGSAIGRVIIT